MSIIQVESKDAEYWLKSKLGSVMVNCNASTGEFTQPCWLAATVIRMLYEYMIDGEGVQKLWLVNLIGNWKWYRITAFFIEVELLYYDYRH